MRRALVHLALACAAALSPPAAAPLHADAADDLPRILRTRELKREGDFVTALQEAQALLDESEAADRPDYERRNRRLQVEILTDILSRSPDVQAEVVAAEENWYRAYELLGKGQPTEAEAASRASLATRTRIFGERHHDVATSLAQLALILSLQDRYDETESLYVRALSIYNELLGENSAASAQLHNDLAGLYSAQAKYAKAEEHFRIHLDLFRRFHPENEEEIATALGNLAVTLGNRGDPAAAMPLLHEALRIRRRIHPPGHLKIAVSLNLIGSNLYARGDRAAAEAMYREALAIREESLGPDHPVVAVSLSNLAVVLAGDDRLDEARALHERALAIRQETFGDRHRKTARSLQNLGEIHRRIGNDDRAEELFRQARSTTVEIHGEDHPAVASLDRSRARLAAQSGRLGEAAALFRASLETYRATYGHAHETVAAGWQHLGDIALRQGRLDDAVAHYRESVTAYEAVRSRFDSPVDRASFRKSPEPRLAAALLESGRGEEAWPFVERARGRLLGDLLRVARPEVAGSLPPSSYGRPATLEEIRSALDERTALIGWLDVSISGAKPRAWAWVLRRHGPVRWVRLEEPRRGPSGPDVWERLREALVLAGSWPFRLQEDGGVLRDAQTLGDRRLRPLLPHLDGVESLVVVPSGPLQGIPIEALRDENGEAYGTRWTISYAPSPRAFAWLASRAGASPLQRALLLGDPPCAPPFPPLPGAREEVSRIARFFPESHALIGEDANESTLIALAASGELAGFDAIHLATHAVADPDRPERSTLALAAETDDGLEAVLAGDRLRDGFLTADEIVREWQLDADLVTLSGCGTALGKRVAGEGFLGFAHAFFQAGARSLVLSLWKVDDEATGLLMSRFYENLTRKGLGKAAALREARTWLRDWRDPAGVTRFEHPAYWSAFVLIGEAG